MKIKALALTMVLLMLLSTVGCDGAFLEVLKGETTASISSDGADVTVDPDITTDSDVTTGADVTTDAGAPGGDPSVHNVVFLDEDGKQLEARSVPDGTIVTAPEAPKKEGYTVLGWYTSQSDTAPYDFNTAVTGDLTLVARYRKDAPPPPTDSIPSVAVSDDKKTVTVSVNVLAPCTLLVRFIDEETYYSEQFPQNKVYIENGAVFAKGDVAVAGESTVTLNVTGTLPSCFVAEAVLLDASGKTLAEAYNVRYTTRYEDFLNTTKDDFAEDDTVIADGNGNLLVLADDVRVLTAASVVQETDADGETLLYRISAPSAEIRVGDKIYITAPNCEGAIFRVAEIRSGATRAAGSLSEITVKVEDSPEDLSAFYKFSRV
ncbi:MAG: InlB B-repeat-containing protein, partial [Clostridia bacterium]|nr:InlB B-repeat-containing protein [Clostridia bacterium]